MKLRKERRNLKNLLTIGKGKDKEKEFKDLWIVKAFQAYDGLINSRSKSQRPSDKE